MSAADKDEIRQRAVDIAAELIEFIMIFVPSNVEEQRFYDSILINLNAIRALAIKESWTDIVDEL